MTKYNNKTVKDDTPYGYIQTDAGLALHPYRSEVVKLIGELASEGVKPDYIDALLNEFNVPKLDAPAKELDFVRLKHDILVKWQERQADENQAPEDGDDEWEQEF
jgi:hypothetical protein